MLNPIELGALGTASIGGISMFWNNIKGIFARFESIFIVKAELSGYAAEDFMSYCWKHFKPSFLGIRKFQAMDLFIRPKNRFGRVINEGTGQFITFWKGKRPLFVSIVIDNNKQNVGNVTISFIRGTFDLEKLIIDSNVYYDIYRHEKTDTSFRYYVRRCFGRKKRENNVEESAMVSKGQAMADTNQQGLRPLLYSKEDLGVPTSKKPMENLAYDESVQDFFEEANRWKNSQEWFKDRGLAWRFGALLSGPPGSGKSSLARAIGQSLDMPIHSYDLTTMDNEELVNNWQNSLAESPCIVLLEDIDRIFDENRQIKTYKDKSPLTLDCLLNCISGVQPSDGIFILVTANDPSKLDPALGVPDETGKSSRPGRLDRAVYIGILSEEGRYKIANRILSDNPELIKNTVDAGKGETGAQFESRCSKLALEHYWGGPKVYGIKTAVFESIKDSKNTTFS